MAKVMDPVHPGEVLQEEFLEPLRLSQTRVATAIGVSPRRINEIVLGKRAITADTSLRLGRFFGMSEGFWLNMQVHYDLEVARDGRGEVLNAIVPLPPAEGIDQAAVAEPRPAGQLMFGDLDHATLMKAVQDSIEVVQLKAGQGKSGAVLSLAGMAAAYRAAVDAMALTGRPTFIDINGAPVLELPVLLHTMALEMARAMRADAGTEETGVRQGSSR